MNAPSILRVRQLSYAVGGKMLLSAADLDLRRGELHVVIGRNGAGKSTLLKLLTGELAPAQGTIDLWDLPLHRHRGRVLARRRAVLAQHTPLNFDYQVIEVVLLGRIPHQRNQNETEADVAIAHDCLREVGMDDCANRSYLTLSGGEQQRVHFARVLAQIAGTPDDRLLFLDEPTSSLDLHHQNQVLAIARALTRTGGVTVLAVLHDLNLAARYADRITLLSAGRVIASGTPAEVLREDMLYDAFQQKVLVTRHPCLDCPLVVST